MNTKTFLKEIISHKEIYGQDGSLDEAVNLIRDIPSVTLLYHLSRISMTLYLDQPGPESVTRQNRILNSYLPYCNPEMKGLFQKAFDEVLKKGNWQVVFWEYSTMLFYNLIFQNHNDMPLRDLFGDENDRFLNAYLMINSVINNGFNIAEDDVSRAMERDEIERILVPGFIYQRDYVSNLDFSNQLNRGLMFFDFLEGDSRFSGYLPGFYAGLGVAGKQELYKTLLTIFAQCEIERLPNERKNQIGFAGLETYISLEHVDSLAINGAIAGYSPDRSFSAVRVHPLYKIMDKAYLVLSLNFLLDKFFKSQVFAFKAYIEANGFAGNFLSIKGKGFMEDIYFRSVMEDCFPKYKMLNGDQAEKVTGGELCDFYIRKGSKILLVEFKDILLNAKIKEGSDEKEVYQELDIKFAKNQRSSPKGITQLFNAAVYLEKHDLRQDVPDRSGDLEIYPIIVYTDNTFGAEGINKILNDKFKAMLAGYPLPGLKVEGVTFINLSYFEMHQGYLSDELIDLFSLLSSYQKYVLKPENSTISFEVYCRAFFVEHDVPDLQSAYKLNENLQKVDPELKNG